MFTSALVKQQLCIDFAALKHSCPKGIYLAPVPDQPLRWSGVIFVHKGQYANAVLRFHVDFPQDYPHRPPIVSLLSDVFHPLVTPLTTYTYTTRDSGADTVSASDGDRLPPGGLNLSHGFPQWFESTRGGATQENDSSTVQPSHGGEHITSPPRSRSTVLTVEVLHYLRVIFDTEAVLDSVPLESAANTGAWHAWRSYRAKATGGGGAGAASPLSTGERSTEPSTSPRQQPGGARRPAEWNWQGVWEDRVKKSVQASISDHMLYAGDTADVISFSKLDARDIDEMIAGGTAVAT